MYIILLKEPNSMSERSSGVHRAIFTDSLLDVANYMRDREDQVKVCMISGFKDGKDMEIDIILKSLGDEQ